MADGEAVSLFTRRMVNRDSAFYIPLDAWLRAMEVN
jgi:hypothetical protein